MIHKKSKICTFKLNKLPNLLKHYVIFYFNSGMTTVKSPLL